MLDHDDLQDFIGCAQENMEGLWDASVTMKGVDYPVAAMERGGDGFVEDGYSKDVRELSFRIRKSLHPARPEHRAEVIFEGRKFYIRGVHPNTHDHIAWHVTCVDHTDFD